MTVDRLDLSIRLKVESTAPVSSMGSVQGQTGAAEREQRARRRPQQKDEPPAEPEPLEAERAEEDKPPHRIDNLA